MNEWMTKLFIGQPRLHRVCQTARVSQKVKIHNAITCYMIGLLFASLYVYDKHTSDEVLSIYPYSFHTL